MREVLHTGSRFVRVAGVACLALGLPMGATELANAQTGALTPGVDTKKVSRLEITPRGNGVTARLSFSFH